jgi:cytochrome c oxidase subunit IV
MAFWGILTILTGVAFAAAAFGLWATQAWAWMFANILAVFGLLDAVFVMIASGSLTEGLAMALLPLVVLWYINSTDIREAFEIPSRG